MPRFFKKGVYHSDGPTPRLSDCIAEAEKIILQIYSTRIAATDPPDIAMLTENHDSAVQFIAAVNREWKKPGNNASHSILNGTTRPIFMAPDALRSLIAATAYFLESKDLAEKKKTLRSWSALLQCYLHIGSANGPRTQLEISRKGVKKSQAKLTEFKALVLQWLNELPENHFNKGAFAYEWLASRLEEFYRAQLEEGQDPAALPDTDPVQVGKRITDWRKKPDGRPITLALARVVKDGLKRGPKPRKSP